ncbi:hypothetical protein MAR_021042 [Mya arenaria]|uniref:Ig-like domain-containing protein n=1 Tax=Mya arenaria TaxID=6604 RepID=A0ABY7E6J7_MYAAR|nr:hypothetical protein MAR_021042 [Mya arenaria]
MFVTPVTILCVLAYFRITDNPDKRVFVNNQTNNTDYYLIRNSNTRQSLRCEVNGGNPLATLKWSCYDGIQSDENSQSSAISTVNWIAANLSDSACICSASHILGWTDRRFVNIHMNPILQHLHVKNDNTQHYENGYEELTTLERRTGEKAYSDLDFQQRKEKNNQKKMSAEDETSFAHPHQ